MSRRPNRSVFPMADATRIPSLPASSWRRLATMLAALLFFVAAVLPPLLVFLAAALHHGGARGTTAVADAMRWSGAQGRGGATGDAGPWPQGGQQTRRDGGVPARSNLGMADLAPLPCWLVRFSAELLESLPNATLRETIQGETFLVFVLGERNDQNLVSPDSSSNFKKSSQLAKRFHKVILIHQRNVSRENLDLKRFYENLDPYQTHP